MRIVVALGGHALLRRGEKPESEIQREHLAEVAPALARTAAQNQMVIVHGNGPQVGMLALESASDPNLSRSYPFSDLVAESQGVMGYWLQQGLVNAGLATPVVTLVSQTVVAANDPAFKDPTKFVGSVYDKDTARELAQRHQWVVRGDGGGWRRVVPSPLPTRIVEIDTATLLVEVGTTVIIGGGGGVPVIEGPFGYQGVEAVVDKDHVAALVAIQMKADRLVILTDVDGVMTDFGTPQQQLVRDVGADALLAMDLPDGSMGPKVAAACHFTQVTGRQAAIGALRSGEAVIAGGAGTQIHRT